MQDPDYLCGSGRAYASGARAAINPAPIDTLKGGGGTGQTGDFLSRITKALNDGEVISADLMGMLSALEERLIGNLVIPAIDCGPQNPPYPPAPGALNIMLARIEAQNRDLSRMRERMTEFHQVL